MKQKNKSQIENILIDNFSDSIDRIIFDVSLIKNNVDSSKLNKIKNDIIKEFKNKGDISIKLIVKLAKFLYEWFEEDNEFSMGEVFFNENEYDELSNQENQYNILSYFLVGALNQIEDYGEPKNYLEELKTAANINIKDSDFNSFLLHDFAYQTHLINKMRNIIVTPVMEFDDNGFNNSIFIEAFIAYFAGIKIAKVAILYLDLVKKIYKENKSALRKKDSEIEDTLEWWVETLEEIDDAIEELDDILLNDFDKDFLIVKN